MPIIIGFLMRKLVLFDIDQTLVKVVHIHSEAYAEMFREVFGVEGKMEDVKYDGKRFPEIVREVALLHDVGEMAIESKQEEALQCFVKHFTEKLPEDISEHILPGVFTLLEKISQDNHVLGIVTGNSRPITEAILRTAKIYDYFKVFAYGTEAQSREKLVELALKKADEKYFIHFKEKDLVIIGDSIHDIDSGKPRGARTIAVATGSYSSDELKEHEPDYIFKDMRNAEMVYKAIVE